MKKKKNKKNNVNEKLVLGLKGFIMGVANIIPGVSGGTLAITLGIYEKLISSISNFFKNWKKSLEYLLPIGIGMILSLLILSNVVGYALDHYPIPTTTFFLGLILGGLPMIMKKIEKKGKNYSNWICFGISFGIVLLFTFMSNRAGTVNFSNMNFFGYLTLIIVGMIASATMVIPGVSGSFVLMLLGYYKPIINAVSELSHLNHVASNMLVLVPFGIGVIIGIVGIVKLIEFLLKKYETKTYFAIIGFILASCVSILAQMGRIPDVWQLFIGMFLYVVGFIIAYKLGEK